MVGRRAYWRRRKWPGRWLGPSLSRIRSVMRPRARSAASLAGRGDPLGFGAPVGDDDGALQAEQRGPAVGLRVHLPGQLVQRLPLEEGPEPGRGGALERGPHQLGGEAARALDGLERDVAGEAVGHHHVYLAGQQVAALDVAGEADRQAPVRRRGEQLVGPPGELVALDRLGADREQAHPRILHAVGHLRVGDTELGELDHHLRLGVGDGTGIHEQRRLRPDGQGHGEAGPQQPGQ